jgi:UDP:flavonoid glycosyltransferase YjiC (YdhE family)
MRILMIAHIGETLGHLVRGLAIADELTAQGVVVEFAASDKGEWLLKTWKHPYVHHRVRWNWSHNSCDPDRPSPSYLSHVSESVSDVLELLDNVRPDLVIGLPGIFTTQAARHLMIPHVSVLHGPYLVPLLQLKELTPTESAVLQFANKIFTGGCVDTIYSHLSNVHGMPELSYETYLQTETIFVPQPELRLPHLPNIHQVRFIRASFGPPVDLKKANLAETCYVTFGSGNPCDITRIIELAHHVFPFVVVSTGRTRLGIIRDGVIAESFIASSSLAGRVAAVISHGGIGTVGTFAEHRTPQLIIPTELDQATMAVLAAQSDLAVHCGLYSWATHPRLGRRMPEFCDEELLSLLEALRSRPLIFRDVVSSGASDIAYTLVSNFSSQLRSPLCSLKSN